MFIHPVIFWLGVFLIVGLACWALIDRWRMEVWKRNIEARVERRVIPAWQWFQTEVLDEMQNRDGIASILPLVMKQVEKEAANPNPMTRVQLVGIKKE